MLADSRASDRKKGLFGNDLTIDFVSEVLARVCTYCGEAELRMTLDRKDCALAHITSNVVACCIRCNYLRGSMPYEAWLHIAPAVRSARLLGLFGDWRSKPIKKALTEALSGG